MPRSLWGKFTSSKYDPQKNAETCYIDRVWDTYMEDFFPSFNLKAEGVKFKYF